MALDLTVQHASVIKDCPDQDQIQSWATLALDQAYETAEITIRIVDEKESADLNERYRNKSASTNVLSFPYEREEGENPKLIGDIVICAPVVAQEATEQGKDIMSHWAHMVVHGTLHLMGYDHINEDEAETMESIELVLMKKMGFEDPYLERQN